MRALLVALLAALAWPAVVKASDVKDAADPRRPPKPRELAWSPAADGSATIVATAMFGTMQGLRGNIAPSECRWCGASALDRSARDAFAWKDTHTADVISSVLGYAVGPALILGADALAARHDGAPKAFFVDALLMVEATVIALDATEIVKVSAGRARPYTVEGQRLGSDDNLSFFSGHTSLAFSVMTSAGTIATLRGYRWAPLVWMVGVPYALTTGYLRVAADKHWMTDVLAGAFVGAAIGFSVPFFFHHPVRAAGATVRIAPMGAGAMLMGEL